MERDEQLVPKMMFINEAYLRTMSSHASPVIKSEIKLENNQSNDVCLEKSTGDDFKERHILEDDDTRTIRSDEEKVIVGFSSFENCENLKIEIDRPDEEYTIANNDKSVMNFDNEKCVETDKLVLSDYYQEVKLENEESNSSLIYPMTNVKEENQVGFEDFHDIKLEVDQEADISFNNTDHATIGGAYSEFYDQKPTESHSNIQESCQLSCEAIPDSNCVETTQATEGQQVHSDSISEIMENHTKMLDTRTCSDNWTSCKMTADWEEQKMSDLTAQMRTHTGEKPHQCSICRKTFCISSDLKRHTKIHTGEKPHQCSVCAKAFIQRSALVAHMRTHTGEKPHQCSVCRRSFCLSSNLSKHMRTHTGEKPHQCSVCIKAFGQSSDLMRHMRIHTGQKIHPCSVCREAFSKHSDLTKHMRIHTGEKPHQCSVCIKSFRQSYDLMRHMKIHTGEKPHQCSVCRKSFRQSSQMQSHMRTHTGEKPHQCSVCRKSFSQNSQMQSHMSTHTGEKPHQCSVCGKAFNRSSNLMTHMRVHTGERPHQCSVCEKAFSRSFSLTKHMRSHTR